MQEFKVIKANPNKSKIDMFFILDINYFVKTVLDENFNNKLIVECDKEYYRPLEVDTLLGDSRKAKRELNWRPKTNIKELINEMVKSELRNINN